MPPGHRKGNIMMNGTLLFIEEVVRQLTLPSTLEKLEALCQKGLNQGEKNILLEAVEGKWEAEHRAWKEADSYLFKVFLDKYDFEDEGDEEDEEEVTDKEWDEWEAEEDEEWRRRKGLRDRAKEAWDAVAGEWVKVIEAAHYPRGRGTTVVVDLPHPEGWEDGRWSSREARRDWKRVRSGRIKEAKECMKTDTPLPEWAVEVPLTFPRALRLRGKRGVAPFMEYTSTSALEEALEVLEGWACEGRSKTKLQEVINQEIDCRRW